MMFDGAVFVPLRGVDTYFDPANSGAINQTYIANSRGWYDPVYREYNLLIPTGAAQQTCNTWLVYDLVRKRWYQKDTGAAAYPQAGWQVTDTQGRKYIYGAIDTGYMERMEYGTTWSTTAIAQEIETGDFFPDGNNPWNQTVLRRVKLLAKRITEDTTLTIYHYPNTSTVSDDNWTLALKDATTNNRILRGTEPINLPVWAHRLKFSVSTSSTAKGLQALGWGYEFRPLRRDH
jgi:hypothetical protein